MCYISTMRTKYTPDGQKRPSFIEAARRAQLIECAIETIATLGYAQASLAQIARRANISKSVITYYFASKEELLEQVVTEIYTAAVQAVTPQIAAQPTAALRLQAYIRSAVDYIGTHRMQMVALLEIALNFRTADGKLRYSGTEEWILTALEALLRQGQEEGEFRAFDLRVMAVTIRRAIDAVAPLFAANPNLDVESYAQELVTLFDRATRKE
ncbi:MAG TPA: TetR/AcrR family transcriptional regulator [Ktedonobacteraceae bacterium]|nr:TetR/AcrR family transcriptional regulator [Ktedonobacteraceae bacterium]